MQECIDLNEGVLDNLRGTIDHDSLRIANLQIEVHQLKVDVKKKNKLISKLEKEAKEDCVMWDAASQEMVEKARLSGVLESFGGFWCGTFAPF